MVDVLTEVAAELGRPMAAVALAWLMQRPGVGSVLVGASRAGQLTENIASLEIVLTGITFIASIRSVRRRRSTRISSSICRKR